MSDVDKRAGDSFGNVFAPGLPYARGEIISSGSDEFAKLGQARHLIAGHIEARGTDSLFNLSGLERGMTLDPSEIYNDETSPAVYDAELTRLALEHLGGDATTHDVLLLNRQSAALLASLMVLIESGDTVVGASVGYTHPAVTRPLALLGARFIDSNGRAAFEAVMKRESHVDLVVLTRLSVSYEILSLSDIQRILEVARERSIPVLVDDAGGARVGPAVYGQPRTLQLGVELGSTGLDKYGVLGPRLGLLGGRKDLISAARTRAFEFGLEARPMLYPVVVRTLRDYTEDRVRGLARCTVALGEAMEKEFGSIVRRNEISVKVSAEDILTLALDRAHLSKAPIVPYEALAVISMILLRDHGVLTVHFAGLPPGTSQVLFKLVSPETMERFGGPRKLATAINNAVDQLSEMLHDPDSIREFLLGPASAKTAVVG
jgi:L-seryl-tRNA(Ser) seleniumtransferase